jgi:glycosyltransferase involved in cell wall biosynthesis
MSRLPSISVVTPCINAAATIQQTIDSVAEQDYPGELEHLIIDGGSTDGTLEIVRAAGLRYISEPDRGLTHALVKSIDLVRNEIFAQLNADDRYFPGTLRAVGEGFAANPDREWLTGQCVIVDGDGIAIRPRVTHYKNFLLRHYSFPLYLTQNFISAPATFVRAEALRAVGGFDERFAYSMDYDVWLKLARRGAPIILHRPLAQFRMSGATLSLTGYDRQFAEHAINAAENGQGYRIPVLINRVLSRLIIEIYRQVIKRNDRIARRRAERGRE